MDLTVSERVLIVIKAFGLIGKEFVELPDIIETLLISEDLLGQHSLSINYITNGEMTVPTVEGSIEILEKMAFVQKKNNGYELTERGEIILSSKLSNIKALNFLKTALEIAKLPRSRRKLYSLIVIYNTEFGQKGMKSERRINKALIDAYNNYKKKVKKVLIENKK